MERGIGQGAVRNGLPCWSLQNNISQGASGKMWVSKSLCLNQKGQSSEETQPLKQKELMLAVTVQLSLIISYNNYTPAFSSLLKASLSLLRAWSCNHCSGLKLSPRTCLFFPATQLFQSAVSCQVPFLAWPCNISSIWHQHTSRAAESGDTIWDGLWQTRTWMDGQNMSALIGHKQIWQDRSLWDMTHRCLPSAEIGVHR